uniref:Sialic acid binding Ig like lectin 1 n=1 Tax=Aquila chrysaetos chrysaetos TaxID=223781 RepID=A0A663DJI4_AQUCH
MLPSLGSWGVTYPESLRGVRGSCVVVPCTLSYPTDVTASDGIVAIWYKDYDNQKTVVYHSAAQEVDARFKGRAQLLGDPAARNCTLLLQGVTPEDGGPYRFRFEIINGDRWSAARDLPFSPYQTLTYKQQDGLRQHPAGPAQPHRCLPCLSVLPADAPKDTHVSVSPSTQNIRVGDTVSLTCELSSSYPPISAYRWYKDGVARPHCGDLPSCSILSPPADPPRTPTITLFQETQGGRLAIVRCAVDSHPPAAVALYRDGTLLAASGSQAAPRQRFGVTASRNALRLEIRGVGPQDSGEYRCTASNAYGNASTAKLFDARGESPPDRESSRPLLSSAGWGCSDLLRLILLCAVESNPLSEITLLKGGGHISPAPNALRLELPEASEEDEGEYECRARSPLGSACASLPLRVQGESGFAGTQGSPAGMSLSPRRRWEDGLCRHLVTSRDRPATVRGPLDRGGGGGGVSQTLPGLASRPFSPPPPSASSKPVTPQNPTGGWSPATRAGGGGLGHTPHCPRPCRCTPGAILHLLGGAPGGGGRPSCSAPSTASHPPASPCAGVPASHPWSPRGARPSHASLSRWPPTPCGWRWGGWSCGTRGSTSARPTTATAPRPRPCTWTWEVRGGPEPWRAPYRRPGGSSCGTVALRSLSGGGLGWCCPVNTQVLGCPRLPSLPPLPQASQSRLSPRQKSPKAPQPP